MTILSLPPCFKQLVSPPLIQLGERLFSSIGTLNLATGFGHGRTLSYRAHVGNFWAGRY